MMRWVIAIAVGVLAAAVAWYFELSRQFGAHPFWAEQVIFWGAPIGIGLAVICAPLQYAIRTGSILFLAGVAYAVAHVGKMRFAASYAEDAFAGQMWFFGWHATIAFLVAGIVSGALIKR